jgi:pimeloyl-ACP methyl ester carboxylesterase
MSELVTSRDGTRIAFERTGSGPPLILIDAAGHFRANSPFGDLADLLEKSFTVVRYDRRGRGESTDTPPYAPAREVDDLAALIDAIGEPASLYGFSSGCLVALHASAAGLPVRRLALVEPPIESGSAESVAAQRAFTTGLQARAGADVVEFFLAGIGVPDAILARIRGTAHWDAMVSIAPTLVYDSLLSEATDVGLLRRVTTPTLVVDSTGSSPDLTGMAANVAAILPDATAESLPGEWHGIPAHTLEPVLTAFLNA